MSTTQRRNDMHRLRWRDLVASEHGPPSTTRLVLLTLSTFMDRSSAAWPSTMTLAECTGLSERAVCTHLEAAERDGWITRSTRGGGRGWKRHTYRATVPDALQGLRPRRRTERRSAPNPTDALNEVQHDAARGTEPHARGTEPHDTDALNVVQSNPLIEPEYEPVTEVSTDKPSTTSVVGSDSNSPNGSDVVRHLHAELQARGQAGIASGRPWGTAVRCANAALQTYTADELTAVVTWAMDSDHWRRKLQAEGAKLLKAVAAEYRDVQAGRPASNGNGRARHVDTLTAPKRYDDGLTLIDSEDE